VTEGYCLNRKDPLPMLDLLKDRMGKWTHPE
jgi:hypothetical protein